MAEAYTVAAEFTLATNAPKVLRETLELFERLESRIGTARGALDAFDAALRSIGKAGSGINSVIRSLDRLQDVKFPAGLEAGALSLDRQLSAAVSKMAEITSLAKEAGAAMRDMRVPTGGGAPVPRVPGGGGGHGHSGGDPVMQGLAGGAALEFLGGNYERFSTVDQVYRAMQSDSNLAGADNPVMAAIRGQAAGQMDRYRVLHPLDVARNAAEAYAISGGKMDEQAPIADMLDRLEQNMVLRGRSPEDAQRQAAALVKAGDIANRFFDPKTHEFSITRANSEMDRLQALVAVGGGFTTGQSILSFEKSAKLAGQRLDLEGEAELAHFVETDPRNAGNRLNSLENLFGGHAARMRDKDKAYWTARGLYDKNGMLKDNDLLYRRPMEWIAKHFGGMASSDIDDHTQRMNVSGIAQEATGSIGNINRQAAATARSNVDANATNLLNSPIGATILFDASLERFRTTLGKFEAGPGIKILDGLTNGLSKLDDILEKHPQATDALLKLTAALAGFAVVRGAVSLLGLGDGIAAVSRGLGLMAGGTAAGEALTALTAASGAGSLFGLASGIVALGAAVIALPPFLRYLFGNNDPNTTNPVDAHGRPNPNYKAGTRTPQQAMQDRLDGMWDHVQHPVQRGNARGLNNVHKESYRSDEGGMLQPIHIDFHVDGDKFGRLVETHIIRRLQPGAMTGGTDIDLMAHPLAPGRPIGI